MRTRLLTLPAVALLAAGVAAAPPNPPGAGGQPNPGGTAGTRGVSLDGQWTVISAARGGSPIPGADKMTVTIKGNVVTFAGTGADKSMRALRLDFGRDGVLFVREAGADGKFDTAGAGTQPGAGATTPGTKPGTTPPARTPPGTGAATGAGAGATARTAPAAGLLLGAYVMTPDFLALSVSKPGAGLGLPGAGQIAPGGPTTGTGTNPPPPTGGKGTQPGGAGAAPGGTGAAGALGSPNPAYLSVILKRGGTGGTK